MALPLAPLDANTPNRNASFLVDTKEEPIDSDQPLFLRLAQRAKNPLRTSNTTFISVEPTLRVKGENDLTVEQQQHDAQLRTFKQQYAQKLQEQKKRKQDALGPTQPQRVSNNYNNNDNAASTSAQAKIWGMINLWEIASKELETSGASQKDKVLKMCHYFDILSPAASGSRKLDPLPPPPVVYQIADDTDDDNIDDSKENDEVMLHGFIQKPEGSEPPEKKPRLSDENSAGASSSDENSAGAGSSITLQVGMAVQHQQQQQNHQHQDWQRQMASEQLKLDEMKVNLLQQALDIDKRMRDLQEQTMVAVLQRAQSEMQRAQAEMQRTLAQATRAQVEVKRVQAEVLKVQAEVQKAQAEARIAEAEEELRKAQIASKMESLKSDGLKSEMVNGYFGA
ncbi:hypothetical protein BGX26_007217 [Mortierella sp. AD094]|nr:hypothetical protein BGX26_007217 [Mortierella sp. AD094]